MGRSLAELRGRPSAPRVLRPGARPRSIGVRPLTPEERAELVEDERDLRRLGVLQSRPRTWGECKADGRPCPWVSCAHHLYIEVNPTTGAIKLNFPDKEVDELAATCSLKVAEDRGALSLDETGKLLNLSQERLSQIEASGLEKVARFAKLTSEAP